MNFYWADAVRVKESTGKGIFSQYSEIVRLRLSNSLIGPSEYYLYRIHDDAVMSRKDKNEFLGWRAAEKLDGLLNDPSWCAIANDKLLFYSTLHASSIAYPKLKAVLHNPARPFSGVKQLNNVEEVVEFLRDQANYPFFMKPIHGTYGRGAKSAVRFDPDRQCIHLGSDEEIGLDEAISELTEGWTGGYLFQETVVPCQEIVEVCGDRVSSLRVIVILNENHAPELLSAVWKVPTGLNMSDNFMKGRSGNLVGAINLETGVIDRIVAPSGALVQEANTHPDTKANLVEFRIPDWEAIVDICRRGASSYPGLRLQHWDIALSKDGPLVLEVNVQGGFDVHQAAYHKGKWNSRLRQLC